MTKKISKSQSTTPNMDEMTLECKLKAMLAERNYWKLRYKLRRKYGLVPEPGVWNGQLR